MSKRPFELKVGPLRFVVYRVAEPRWEFIRNVYPKVIRDSGVGKTIGWALVAGSYCWSFVFRSPTP